MWLQNWRSLWSNVTEKFESLWRNETAHFGSLWSKCNSRTVTDCKARWQQNLGSFLSYVATELLKLVKHWDSRTLIACEAVLQQNFRILWSNCAIFQHAIINIFSFRNAFFAVRLYEIRHHNFHSLYTNSNHFMTDISCNSLSQNPTVIWLATDNDKILSEDNRKLTRREQLFS
jgi:hypothetical protein